MTARHEEPVWEKRGEKHYFGDFVISPVVRHPKLLRRGCRGERYYIADFSEPERRFGWRLDRVGGRHLLIIREYPSLVGVKRMFAEMWREGNRRLEERW